MDPEKLFAEPQLPLGRLLNLCDGILGHGLRVLVLLTTDEDLGQLHPAVTRPGRCLSQIEFEPLLIAAARRWLGGRHRRATQAYDPRRTLRAPGVTCALEPARR